MKNNRNRQIKDVTSAQGVRHAQGVLAAQETQGTQKQGGQGVQNGHAQDSQEQVSSIKKELATPANIVTLARILLIPVFVAVILSPWPEWFPDPGFGH